MTLKGRRATTKQASFERRRERAAWVAEAVIPHEPAVRALLTRWRLSPPDIDEVIQDCYCRFSTLESVSHIERPRAYFISAARNFAGRRMQRARVVAIDAHAEMDLFMDDRQPSPEQEAGGRLDYRRMLEFLAELPERCRRIVEMRKLEGWSQKEIAAQLGVTEKVVEKQVWLGVKAIQRAWAEADLATGARLAALEAEEGDAR
ncbi:RNA polymerase sigma factor [Hephaestia mangrovi]|uniref:RNA polymerase sigma factor n=1 Tax=Hephaestia mangrovi TaxID=2873268 RepID=UPI001CA65D15|nr:sigma-70 family RNA polymerase sigma factor [Hephaestia mangrovi]MBY8826599.1 sigma-70 family RNA polymerase sigma factor [Hephaestia mangrovi]